MNSTIPSTIPTIPSPLAGIQIDLGPTIGADLIGLVFAAIFHGITSLQTIFYYQTYPEDRPFLKYLVGIVWALDSLSLALLTHGVYTYLITDYGNPIALTSLVWSIANEPIVTATISLIAHLFMAYRIQVLNNKWKPLAIIIAIASLFPPVVAIYTLHISDSGSLAFTALTKLRWTAYAGDVSTSIIDMTIAASISYLLYQNRSGFSQTDRMLNKLTLYILSNGLITTALTTATLIAYVAAPTQLYCQMLNMSVSKAYSNTMLATLNSRRSLRESSTYASTEGYSGIAFPLKGGLSTRAESRGASALGATLTQTDSVSALDSYAHSRDLTAGKPSWV